MLKKIASIAALFSSAAALSACTTAAGKPQECLPAFVMKNRCAKIPQSVKDANRAPVAKIEGVEPNTGANRRATQRMDAYGQPI